MYKILMISIWTILFIIFLSPSSPYLYGDQDTTLFIHTPNGSKVEVIQRCQHFDDSYWENVTKKWDDEYAGLYLYRLGPATFEYNCHAYAFAGRRHTMPLDSLYWLNFDEKYIADYSYQEVDKEQATIAVYSTKEQENSHSMCFYDSLTVYGQAVVTSKWGACPTYRHILFTDIYSTPADKPDTTLTRYFRPWPDPWFIEKDTVLEMMAGNNFRRSLGSIVINEGVTVTIAENDTLMMHAGKSIDIYGTLILKRGACITKCFGSDIYPPEWLEDSSWEGITVQADGTLIMEEDASIEYMNESNIAIGGQIMFGHEVFVETEWVDSFQLKPSYPNPFNISTAISYTLNNDAQVLLDVYAGSGQKVATLVDEQQAPGMYETIFDAAELASGMYFIRLKAGNMVQKGKLMLLK